jgi:hypothetical protein
LQAGVNTKGVNSAKKLANRPTRTKGDFAGEILRRLTGNQAGVICKRVKSWQKIKFWGWLGGRIFGLIFVFGLSEGFLRAQIRKC